MAFAHDSMVRCLALFGWPAAQLAYADVLASQDAHRPAFPMFAFAARRGVRHAQYRLGRCYLLGLGVPASTRDALRWLLRAAEAGETAAQTQLATLALQGITNDGSTCLFTDTAAPPVADYARAEYWARLAAATGSAEAKALLGMILTSGPPEYRDVSAGEAYYRESADAGWAFGQFGLAMKRLHEGTREAMIEARDLLRKSAHARIPLSFYIRGVIAETGATGEADFTEAAEAYHEAAELGLPEAQLRYGLALLTGRGVRADTFAAETWLRRAALNGQTDAAAALGDLHMRDSDGLANYPEASVWYIRAAEAGHTGSARMLGRLYRQGTGVAKDVREAARWLRLAIDNGDDGARDELAALALTRQVGDDDQRETFAWFQRLALDGSAGAQLNLGICLAQGIGTSQDDAAALAWFRKAATTLPVAALWVESLLVQGRGGEPDDPAPQLDDELSAAG